MNEIKKGYEEIRNIFNKAYKHVNCMTNKIIDYKYIGTDTKKIVGERISIT